MNKNNFLMIADSGGSFLNVAVRIKPLIIGKKCDNIDSSGFKEEEIGGACWHVDGNTITQVINSTGITSFTVDQIFEATTTPTNRIVYEAVGKRLVEYSVLKGINATMFAYGQTSTGKTWTIMGSEADPGVIPLALQDLFSLNNGIEENVVFTVKASYLEIYNEVISDLLDRNNTNLKVHETPERGVFVGKLSEWVVNNSQDALFLLQRGEENRRIGCTNMNERSSRSHTIFQLLINSRPKEPKLGGRVRNAILTFVDLAGSERVGQTGAEGLRLKEGGHINKSLLALTSVVSKLAEPNAAEEFIPYRDSKLTRILQPALGGNSATTVLCAISPNSEFVDETLSTLKFAIRARSIRNVPTTNEIVIPEAKAFKLEKENQSLKRRIEEIEEQQEVQKKTRKLALDARLSAYSSRLTRLSSSLKELLLIANHTFADITASNGSLRKKLLGVVTTLSESKSFAQQELATLTQIAQATEADLEVVMGEKESIKVECDRLRKDLEERPVSIDYTLLSTELSELNEHLFILGEKCEGTMEQLHSQIMSERSRADKAEMTLRETEDLLNGKEADIEELLNRLGRTQQDARRSQEEMNFKVNDFEEQIIKFKRECERVEGLEVEVENYRKEVEAKIELEQTCVMLKKELNDHNIAIEELKHCKSCLEQADAKSQAAISELANRLTEKELELTKRANELLQIESVLKEKTELLTLMESKVEQRHNLLDTLRQTHVEELKSLMLKLATAESGLAAKNEELLNLKSELYVKLSHLEAQIATLSQKNSHLESELHQSKQQALEEKTANEKLEAEKAEWENKFIGREKELETTRMDLQMIRNSLKTRQENHERTIDELSKARHKLLKLEEEEAVSQSSDRAEVTHLEKQLIKTRLELERARDQFAKEKRLMTLRMAEMDEELCSLSEKKENSTPINNNNNNKIMINEQKTPTLNVIDDMEKTPPSAIKLKSTTPKQLSKYRSFLSPSQNNATPSINPDDSSSKVQESTTTKKKKSTPECAQQ